MFFLVALLSQGKGQAPAACSGSCTLLASNLRNPRGLWVDESGVFVAEGGYFPPGVACPTGLNNNPPHPCIDDPEGGYECLYYTGSVALVRDYQVQRIIEYLPSLAGCSNTTTGPGDVILKGTTLYVVVQSGVSQDQYQILSAYESRLSTVLEYAFTSPEVPPSGGDIIVSAGPLDFVNSYSNNNYGEGDNTDLFKIAIHNNLIALADSGADVAYIANLDSFASTHLLYALPAVPQQDANQPVPTAIAYHDGYWYVGELTGVPFPTGASTIYKISTPPAYQPFPTDPLTPVGSAIPWVTGLTAVTAFDFDDAGNLWVLGNIFAGTTVWKITPNAEKTVCNEVSSFLQGVATGIRYSEGYLYIVDGSNTAAGRLLKIRAHCGAY